MCSKPQIYNVGGLLPQTLGDLDSQLSLWIDIEPVVKKILICKWEPDRPLCTGLSRDILSVWISECGSLTRVVSVFTMMIR